MYFKKMVGKKCFLSPMDVNDVEKFTEWLNDLEVISNLSIYNSILNTETEKEILVKLSKEHNYSIIDISTNELIGSCGFMDIDYLNQTSETGIFIGNKKYWNKGYGTEALMLLLDYGFKALNLKNIMLKVYSFNVRAIRSYEKIGFNIIGRRREALSGNKTYDILYMDILYNEFYKLNKINE